MNGEKMLVGIYYMLPAQTTATNINLYQDPNPIQGGHWYLRRNEICL